jgi:hypothetical protein
MPDLSESLDDRIRTALQHRATQALRSASTPLAVDRMDRPFEVPTGGSIDKRGLRRARTGWVAVASMAAALGAAVVVGSLAVTGQFDHGARVPAAGPALTLSPSRANDGSLIADTQWRVTSIMDPQGSRSLIPDSLHAKVAFKGATISAGADHMNGITAQYAAHSGTLIIRESVTTLGDFGSSDPAVGVLRHAYYAVLVGTSKNRHSQTTTAFYIEEGNLVLTGNGYQVIAAKIS